jgi:hypothetical protein
VAMLTFLNCTTDSLLTLLIRLGFACGALFKLEQDERPVTGKNNNLFLIYHSTIKESA